MWSSPCFILLKINFYALFWKKIKNMVARIFDFWLFCNWELNYRTEIVYLSIANLGEYIFIECYQLQVCNLSLWYRLKIELYYLSREHLQGILYELLFWSIYWWADTVMTNGFNTTLHQVGVRFKAFPSILTIHGSISANKKWTKESQFGHCNLVSLRLASPTTKNYWPFELIKPPLALSLKLKKRERKLSAYDSTNC